MVDSVTPQVLLTGENMFVAAWDQVSRQVTRSMLCRVRAGARLTACECQSRKKSDLTLEMS